MARWVTQARPYARAAFETAMQHDVTETWLSWLTNLNLLVAHSEVSDYLANPKVSPQQAVDFFKDIFSTELDQQQINFLCLLADAHRLFLLADIAQLFAEYHAKNKNVMKVDVCSATALSDKMKQRLATALKERLQQSVEIEYNVDPTLLGGAIIRSDKWVINGSVKDKLTQLQTMVIG